MRYRASQTIDVLVKRDDVVEDEETFVIFIHRMADLPAQVVLETPTEQTVTIPAQGPGDASLRQLALGHATLEPSFASYTQTYTAAVGHDVTRTAVSATPNHPGATQVVRLDGVTKGSLPMGLAVGENVISVVVTAEDGQTAMTYTVTVTRAAEAAEAPPPTAPLPGLSGIDTGVKATIHEGALTVTWPKHGRFCDVYVVQGLGFGNPSLPALTNIETPLHCWYIASGFSPTEVRHLEGAGVYRMEWLGSPPRPLTWDGRRNLFTVGVADIEESAQHIPKPLPPDFCEISLPSNSFEEYTLVYYQDPDFYWLSGAYYTRDSDGSAFIPIYATEIMYRQAVAPNSADVVKILRPPYECLNLPSRDARLSGLTIAGAGGLDFDQDRLKYAVRVGRDTAEATVTATPTNDGATYTVEMDGTVYADRTPPLALGPNVVRIAVTAEDDEVSNTYTVTVTRDSSIAEVEVLSGGQVAEGDAIEVRVTIDQLRIDPGPEHTFLITLAGPEACSESPPGCPPGDYAIRVILYSDTDVELASDSSDFSVVVSGLPLSDDAALLRLALTRVPLAFDPATLTYAVSVGHDVTETTVTARPNHAGAAHEVSLDGVVNLDGTCELAVGENVIAVVVTAEDDMATRTYAVTVTRAAAAAVPPTVIPDPPTHSDDATLRSLALTGATLTFAPATQEYTVSVGNEVAETTVIAVPRSGGATYVVTLNGRVDADGVIPLAVGENVVAVAVTAEDGETTQTYTVTVTRAEASGLSDDAWLRALELTRLPPYSLHFSPLTTDYTDYPVSVGNEVAETTVTAATRHAGATYVVTLDGAAYADGVIPLAVGRNVIAVVVTAEDRETTRTYTIALDRAGSDDATLGALELTGATLTFDPATLTYPVSVGNEVAETTVTAETHHAGATYVVQLDGVPDPDGTVELAVGVNSVSVVVTAEDGETTETYTVTVTRAEPLPGPAVAIGLSPSGSVAEGTEITVTMTFANLEPDQDTSDTDYIFRADVVDSDACEGGHMGEDRYMYKVDENPEVRDGIISAACPPGDYTVEASISSPHNVELASGATDFTITGPPPPPATDATLGSLTLSGIDFGLFNLSTTGYTASVANDATETTVTATTNDEGATYVVMLDGVPDPDGTVELAVGGNSVSVVVTAEDGQTTMTYTVTVTRAEPPSDDATLGSLALSGVPFTFVSDTTSYDVSVANDVAETTVTATANDAGATYVVQLDRVDDPDGTVELAVGDNLVSIVVTAGDGQATRTYTVTVTRAEPPSADATLSSLALSGIDFGVFDPATTEYTASVASDVTETTVTAAVNDGGATYVVQLNGVDDADGTVELAVGDNTVSVVVTAEDGQAARTYAVTVTRAAPPSTDARLDSLALSDVNFGAFDPATTGYAAAVGNDVEQTTVTARTNDGRATHMVQLDGVPDADGTVPLAVGENIVSVAVTAEDGETTMTYTVAVTRAAAGPTPEDPPETPDAPAGEVTGEGQVRLDWNDVEDASYYQVRFCCGSADWVTLPTDGIEVVFDGSRATVSNLPDYGIYYFSVRAGNAAGVSEWSDYLTLSNAD